jgi:ABC-type multidrug transport system fused ATPase/permease subunit
MIAHRLSTLSGSDQLLLMDQASRTASITQDVDGYLSRLVHTSTS